MRWTERQASIVRTIFYVFALAGSFAAILLAVVAPKAMNALAAALAFSSSAIYIAVLLSARRAGKKKAS